MAKTKVHGEYLDPSVISGQTQVTAVGADSVLIFDATDNALKKALLSDVIETVGSTPTFSQINATSDLTVDAGGDIILDADGADVLLKDGGTQYGRIGKGGGSDLIINASIADKDIFFSGTDGSTSINALVLDMSDAGTATFNHDIKLGDNGQALFGAGDDLTIYHDGSDSYIKDTGTGNLLIQYSDLYFSKDAGSTHSVVFRSTGRVGIGTTGPDSLLHVDGSIDGPLVTIHQTGGASSNYRGLDVETSSTGTSVQRWFNAGSELMRVGGNGNVGIGTASPGARLDVKSSGGSTEKVFHVQDSNGNDVFTIQGGGRATLRYYPLIIGNDYGHSLASGTRFFIDGSSVDTYVEGTGRWAIGETTNVANAYLTVSSNNGEGLTVGRPGNNAYRNYRHVTSSGIHQWISTANTASLSNAGSWTNASDRAYKKDIVDLDYGLDTVKALQPRRYTVKADDSSDIGFIAQELEKHIPELVHGEDGEKGIDYGSMTSVLVKAFQEQQIIIDDLKSRIETLEG